MQKLGRLGLLFVLILLCLFQLPAIGQNKKVFVVTGKIEPEDKTSEIGNIEMSKSGAATTNIEVSKNGRFKLELDYFSEYTLTFKMPGHFSKTIIISTDIPDEVWKRDNNFPPFPMIVQLFKEIEGLDKSFTLKPSGKVYYSKQTDNFEKEVIFDDTKVAAQINSASSQSAQVKKEAGTITKQESQDLAVKQKNYDLVIKEADVSFKRGEFVAALLKYKEAQKLFPEKVYATDRIAEVENLMKALENSYLEAMAKGDKAFTENDFNTAKMGYQTALTIKTSDTKAKEKLGKTEAKIAELAKSSLAYNTAINEANKLVGDKQYKNARAKYVEALQYQPNSDYPKRQIENLDHLLTQVDAENQKEGLYAAKIKEAETFFTKKDYQGARTSFKLASDIKPSESLPIRRIKEIDQLLADLALAEAKNKAIESAYQESIKRADQAFTAKDYTPSRLAYNEALTIKPNEQYPKDQIAKIDVLLKELASAEETNRLYAESIKTAEDAFAQNQLKEAKVAYQKAHDLKPTEPVPPIRIKEIDTMIAQLAEAARLKALEDAQRLAKEKATKDLYIKTIAAADKAFASKQYVVSRTGYSTALGLFPDEKYPKDQISKIDVLLQELASAEETNRLYAESIKTAEDAFAQTKLTEAKDAYQKAHDLKPGEPVPPIRIKEIDTMIAQLAETARLKALEDAKRLAKEKETKDLYDKAIAAADKAFATKEYMVSRTGYSTALSLLPNEQYPKDQISKIDALLKELARVEENNRLYAESIKTAEDAFTQNKLSDARNAYQKAHEYIPTETLPPLRIKDIDKLLAELALQEAKNKAIELAYQESIKRADAAFAAKDYTPSKLGYNEALTIKPKEQYPKDQIAKIDALLKELANAEETNRLYAELIKTAEDAFAQTKLKEARGAYQKAHDLKPDEPEPPLRIKEIDSMIAQLEETARLKALEDAKLLAKEKANRELYAKTIAAADKTFSLKQYLVSRTDYSTALDLLPDEKYPKDQISKIDVLLAQLEEARLLAKQQAMKDSVNKANDLAYKLLLASATEMVQSRQYESAIGKYNGALAIKPDEKYPKDQIAKMNALLKELANAEETNRLYAESIKTAEDAFGQNLLKEAKDAYQKAHDLKPGEPIPPIRIRQIAVLIAQQEEAARLKALEDAKRLAKEKLSKDKYDKTIEEADKAFDSKQYAVSRTSYSTALGILPNEQYPTEQISKIDSLLAARQVKMIKADTLNMEIPSIQIYSSVETDKTVETRAQSFHGVNNYDVAIKKADEAFGIKDYVVARFYYYKAIELASKEEYPKKQVELIRKLVDANLSAIDRSGYEQAIAKADEAFKIKNYTLSKFLYNKALAIKSWEKYPQDQIEEIMSLTNTMLSEKQEQEYRNLIAKGDEALTLKDKSVARYYYNKAMDINSDDNLLKLKIKDVQKLIDQDLDAARNGIYNKLIEQADTAMKYEDFNLARYNYNKALNLKPQERYPMDQLKLIKETLVKPKK